MVVTEEDRDAWSSGLRTRDSSMSGSYIRSGKGKDVASWSAGGRLFSLSSLLPLHSHHHFRCWECGNLWDFTSIFCADPKYLYIPSANGSSAQMESSPESKALPPTAADEQQVEQQKQMASSLARGWWYQSAALSEESMRRLKYCLHWLQVSFPRTHNQNQNQKSNMFIHLTIFPFIKYATAHIDAQILVLRDFTASLHSSTTNPSALISPATYANPLRPPTRRRAHHPAGCRCRVEICGWGAA